MEHFKLIQTSELYSSVTSGETRAVAWSTHHHLALVCTKGLYVMDLLPNPNFSSPNLNFKPTFIPRDTGVNPVLDLLGVDVAALAGEVRNLTTDTDLFLDKALLPQFDSNDSSGVTPSDNSDRHSFVSVQWIQPFPDNKRTQVLVTLTANNRVKLWGRDRIKGWKCVLDVSQELAKLFRDRLWRDARDITDGGHPEANKFRSRALLAATTSVAYHDNRLILAQKNGAVLTLALKVSRDCNDVTVEDMRVITVQKGSKINILSADEEGRLFAGLNNGTVKVLCLNTEPVRDLGSIWEDEDNVPVTEVVSVDKTRVILVKGCHVVVVTLEQGVEVSTMEAFDVGPTSVVSVERVRATPVFVVAVREGPWHLLTLGDSTAAVMTTFEFNHDVVDLNKFSCHGVALSKGGAVWAALQNGFLDDDNATARLLFFTQADINDSCDHLLFASGVADTKDHLEAFRVSLQQNKSQEEVLKKVVNSVNHDKGPNRTFYWLCQLASSVTDDEVLSGESEKLADQFYNAILCQRAELLTKHESTRAWAVRFMKDHGGKKPKGSVAQWTCKTCQSSEVEDAEKFEDCVKCAKGHVWARCVLTLRPCDEPSIAWCEWCESPALNSFVQSNPNVTCPFCDGEFTTG